MKYQVIMRLVLVSILGGVNAYARIDVNHLKDSYAILKDKEYSPFLGKTLLSTKYLENLHRYGNAAHNTIKLIHELFYFNPVLNAFDATVSKDKIATYLIPQIVGKILRFISFDMEELSPEQSAILAKIIYESIDDAARKTIVAQKTFDDKRESIKKEIRTQTIESYKTNILNTDELFARAIRPKLALFKKKFASELSGLDDENILKQLQENARTNQNIAMAKLTNEMVSNSAAGAAAQMIKQNIESRLNQDLVFQQVKQLSTYIIGACQESENQLYPELMPNRILLAFLCAKVDTRSDIKWYFDQLPPEVFQRSFDATAPGYTKTDYEEYKNMLAQKGFFKGYSLEFAKFLPQSVFANATEMEKMLFIGLAGLRYDRGFVRPLTQQRTQYKNDTFTNCGASAIRSFFNLLVQSEGSTEFDVSLIEHLIKSSALKAYYQKHTQVELIDSQAAHDDWNEVIQNLSNVGYARALDKSGNVIYKEAAYKEDGYEFVHELEGGIGDFLVIMLTLLRLSTLEHYMRENNIKIERNKILKNSSELKGEEVRPLLEALFKDLSRDKFRLTVEKIDENTFSFTIETDPGKKYIYVLDMVRARHSALKTKEESSLQWRVNILKNLYGQIPLTTANNQLLIEAFIDPRDVSAIDTVYVKKLEDAEIVLALGVYSLVPFVLSKSRILEEIIKNKGQTVPLTIDFFKNFAFENSLHLDEATRSSAMNVLELLVKLALQGLIKTEVISKVFDIMIKLYQSPNPEFTISANNLVRWITFNNNEAKALFLTKAHDLLQSPDLEQKRVGLIFLVDLLRQKYQPALSEGISFLSTISAQNIPLLKQVGELLIQLDAQHVPNIDSFIFSYINQAMISDDAFDIDRAIVLARTMIAKYPEKHEQLIPGIRTAASMLRQKGVQEDWDRILMLYNLLMEMKDAQSYGEIASYLREIVLEQPWISLTLVENIAAICARFVLSGDQRYMDILVKVLGALLLRYQLRPAVGMINNIIKSASPEQANNYLQSFFEQLQVDVGKNLYREIDGIEILLMHNYNPAYDFIKNRLSEIFSQSSISIIKVATNKLLKVFKAGLPKTQELIEHAITIIRARPEYQQGIEKWLEIVEKFEDALLQFKKS